MNYERAIYLSKNRWPGLNAGSGRDRKKMFPLPYGNLLRFFAQKDATRGGGGVGKWWIGRGLRIGKFRAELFVLCFAIMVARKMKIGGVPALLEADGSKQEILATS